MKGPYLIAIALSCLAAVASAQNNYVEEYDFDNAPPPPRQSRPQSFRPAPAPSAPRTPPVAILKQIDRHNDDGSYTYGYEGADGSFKIETKHVSGEVVGKYGYVDDTGKVRVVEYGANRYGFMPAGEGITVAPPTLVDDTTKKGDRNNQQEFFDDGSYYPEEPQPAPRPAPRPAQRARPAPRPQPQPQYDEYVPPPPPPPPAPRRPSSSGSPVPPRPAVPGAAPVFSPAPVYEERPAPQRAPSPPRQQQRFESLPSSPPQRAAPSPQRFSAPQPQRFAPPPPPPPQPSHRAQHARSSSGILDQLELDYALPQGTGRLTHDISFSSY